MLPDDVTECPECGKTIRASDVCCEPTTTDGAVKGGKVMDIDQSAIEQIAQEIEGWGEGWKFLWNPDDHGRRARLCRPHSDALDYEIEIVEDRGEFYVMVKGDVRRSNKDPWATVSFSAHNPINRKALDYINAQLDVLASEPQP